MEIVRTEYWDFTPQQVYDEIFPGDFPGVDLEHAALIETSMMLHLHPEWVRRELIPDDELASFPAHDTYPQSGKHVPASGVLAPAGSANAAKGKRLLDAICNNMAQAMQTDNSEDE
jgi:creatinine amidohydrolase